MGEWKHQISHGTSNSKGVAILFSMNFEYEIIKEERDKEGCFTIIGVLVNKKNMHYCKPLYPCKKYEK